MVWLRRHFESSMAALDETAERLRRVLADMENDAPCDTETYEAVHGLLTANHTARVTLQDRWKTRHWTAADWHAQRLITQNSE